MAKKLICLLMAAAAVFSLCACNDSSGDETTTAEPTTAFEKYVVAQEIFENLPEPTVLSTYDGKTYSLVEYKGKKCISTEMSRGNHQIIYEFEGDFALLEDANKRTSGSFLYFLVNPESNTDRALMAIYLPSATAVTVVPAPCSVPALLDVPESYELYPYAVTAGKESIHVVNLKEGSLSSYSKGLDDAAFFFDPPEVLFAQEKNDAYTHTSVKASDRTHFEFTVTEVNSKGEAEITCVFTFNPLNGVFVDQTPED